MASEEWALEYLGLSWLRPLMEAFDDDASGYVTITEVNNLIEMRPESLAWRYVLCMHLQVLHILIGHCSIPHWLAYRTVGKSPIAPYAHLQL